MQADTQAHVAFFLTGRRPMEFLDAVDGLNLRPALFAAYGDLTPLRYDFPVVLAGPGSGAAGIESLSGLFDAALDKAAVGPDADRVRKHALRLEQEIRALAAAGESGRLSVLWERAMARLVSHRGSDFDESLRRLRAAVPSDGELADCDAALPRRLLRHVWGLAQTDKAARFRKKLDRLILKLSEILRADFERSAEGLSAGRLQASVGAGYADAFDFDAMSHLLTRSQPRAALPQVRRRRIGALLKVLETQRFFPAGAASGHADAAGKPYEFAFESCGDALKAYRDRLPRLVELARALVVAELEVDGQYDPARHDVIFRHYGEGGLDPQELAQFPDYLVCVDAGRLDAQEHGRLMEILSSAMPIKVLLQIDDLHEASAAGKGLLSGLRGGQLASLAMGLNEVYVLQSSASNLFQFRERVLRGLVHRGPALFSVFSGANPKASGLPPYLVAAAAMESRAFPAFTYDPSAGPNWAARFDLEANPQLDRDWPIQGFAYEDEQQQRVAQDLAFTAVDFLASDRRNAAHLARVPREKWNGSMIAVDESLASTRTGLPDKVPRLLMVDANNVLQQVIADQGLIRQGERMRQAWHSLQELGGVHNSHVEKRLAREQKAWQEAQAQAPAPPTAAASIAAAPAAAAVAATAAAAAAPLAAEEPERSPDEAYIETARCSSCNECTQINGKMFAYDGNQQAYIADLDAGTYAQLVEAAESCQVAVIHPGKPRNPAEPGLEDLLKRAEPFA